MAELDQQADVTSTTEATPTPLAEILDSNAADVPAREQEAGLGGIDAPHVPLKALKKERERRQKADNRQVDRATYNALDQASDVLMKSAPPAVAAQYRQAVLSSPDPVSTTAQILNELGLWQASSPRQQAPQPQTTFPSNLANRRNVGQRHGPAFSGPTPLNDIFRH